MMLRLLVSPAVALLWATALCLPANADEVRAAVAANALGAVRAIADRFESTTGHRVLVSPGSSGKLYAQIREGAPFDVFLSADAERPAQLEREERAVVGSRFVYARGRLVLWSATPGLVEAGGGVLRTDRFRRLAIANPKTAPYGAAAAAVLDALGVRAGVADRLVQGEDITQTFQFVATGNAEIGFVSLSQVVRHAGGDAGSRWLVPAEMHPPLVQEAVLLPRGRDRAAARAFLDFVRGAEARAILRSHGYEVPGPDDGGPATPVPHAAASLWTPVFLTLRLAAVSTAVLLFIGTPLAWWLARTRSRAKSVLEALVALPLVLPPTVLGFYLLLLLGARGWVGGVTDALGWGPLAFTFPGLVIGSALYSLPFVVQPLQNAFEAMGERPLEAAATLGASPRDRFFSIAVPICRPAFVTAAILAFAHTVGEFGVILMIGGSIPGRTQVLSIALYEQVEALEYGRAHALAGGMLFFSFLVLWAIHAWNRRPGRLGA